MHYNLVDSDINSSLQKKTMYNRENALKVLYICSINIDIDELKIKRQAYSLF